MTHKGDIGIFFISGAGLDPSIWDEVIPLLNVPYAIADHGMARQTEASLKEYVDADEKEIKAMPVNRIIIVAHSSGGIIGVELLKRLQDRVVEFVAISALVPLPGQSFASALPFPQNILIRLIMKLFGTKQPEGMTRKNLCNDLTPIQADKVIESLAPEPITVYTDHTSSIKIPSVKTVYVQTTNDKLLNVALQTKMASRLTDCEIKSISSGHLPMITRSKEIASILTSLAVEQ